MVGVSGGADSVALLHVLKHLANRFPLHLGVAHLNHSLREEESDRDADFVKSLAKKLDLSCHIQKTDVYDYQRRHRLSLEDAARQVRYAFFDGLAEKYHYNKVALAHHRDDNAELVLMYLFRGSGLPGIAGISPVHRGMIVRPFVEVGREEILEFLDKNRLDYIYDRSNQDIRFLRNRVRWKLLPLLAEEYNPRIIQSLNRASDILRLEDEWLETLIDPLYQEALAAAENRKAVFRISKLKCMPEAAVRRVVRRGIASIKGDLRRIGFSHIIAISQLIAADSRKRRLDLPDRIRVRCEEDFLAISKESEPLRQLGRAAETKDSFSGIMDYDYEVQGPGLLHIREIDRYLKFEVSAREAACDIYQAGQAIAFFDMDRLHFPLEVRNCRAGDRFIPAGMSGSQKVKKYFSDHKVPWAERARCPLVLSEGQIIWISGFRVAETAKVSATTKSILKVEQLFA